MSTNCILFLSLIFLNFQHSVIGYTIMLTDYTLSLLQFFNVTKSVTNWHIYATDYTCNIFWKILIFRIPFHSIDSSYLFRIIVNWIMNISKHCHFFVDVLSHLEKCDHSRGACISKNTILREPLACSWKKMFD